VGLVLGADSICGEEGTYTTLLKFESIDISAIWTFKIPAAFFINCWKIEQTTKEQKITTHMQLLHSCQSMRR